MYAFAVWRLSKSEHNSARGILLHECFITHKISKIPAFPKLEYTKSPIVYPACYSGFMNERAPETALVPAQTDLEVALRGAISLWASATTSESERRADLPIEG